MEGVEEELERRSKFLNSLIRKKKVAEQHEKNDRLHCCARASDMPLSLQNRAFSCAREHLDSLTGKLDNKCLALALKKEFDASYGPAWHCIVGTSFGSYVTHSLGYGKAQTNNDPVLRPHCESIDLRKKNWQGILMALEWVVIGYAAGAEAVMILLLTLPGLDPLRKGLITVTRNLLKPFMSVVPFCLFLLMDIYWKYDMRPTCESESCSPSEYLRHEKSIMKSQRNALLIASALIFYWILYSVTSLVVKMDQLNQRVERLKNKE